MRNYPSAEALSRAYGITSWLINAHAEGLTNQDSLRQPPFKANCMNWVLGHILVSRSTALELLGQEGVLDAQSNARYRRGSEPITGEGDGVLSLDELLAKLDLAQAQIQACLETVREEELDTVVGEGEEARPLGERIAGLHWHETYHCGQLDLLRQLAGTNDVIVP